MARVLFITFVLLSTHMQEDRPEDLRGLPGGLIHTYPESCMGSGTLSSLEFLLVPPSPSPLSHSHGGVLAEVPTFHRDLNGLKWHKQFSGQDWPLGVTRAGRAARSEAGTGLWGDSYFP